MSEPLGKGDWAEVMETWPAVGLQSGAIFLVDDVMTFRRGCLRCAVRFSECPKAGARLHGYAPPGGYDGVCLSVLRHIFRKRDADKLIETLKAPPVKAPNMESADA